MSQITLDEPIKLNVKFGKNGPEINFQGLRESDSYYPINKLKFEFKKYKFFPLCGKIEELLLNLDEVFNQIKLNNTDDLEKFMLMDSLIFLLEGSGIHSYKNPFLKQRIIQKFWDFSIKLKNKPDISIWGLKRYLALCLDDKNEAWFKLKDKTINKKPLDREEEVYKIVFEDYKKGIVRKELLDEKNNILHEKIKTWFLANYDLYNLKRFEKGLNFCKKSFCSEKSNNIRPDAFEDGYIIKNDNWFQIKNSLVCFLLLIWLLVLFFQPPPFNFIKPFYQDECRTVVGIIMIIAIFLMYRFERFENYSSLLRLFGCILAGYFAINSDESWSGILFLEKDWLKIIFRWVILGFFTFLYLKREILNKIKKNKISNKFKPAVFRKTTAFFVRTAGYSLIVGIFFSDFFGKTMLSRNTGEIGKLVNNATLNIDKITHFPFIVGNIYPEAILSQAPLAMFIGIFINLLWEDRALTEPL